jgi:hypothetical protein
LTIENSGTRRASLENEGGLGVSAMTQEQLLAKFSDLTVEDIRACLALATDGERKLGISQPVD